MEVGYIRMITSRNVATAIQHLASYASPDRVLLTSETGPAHCKVTGVSRHGEAINLSFAVGVTTEKAYEDIHAAWFELAGAIREEK